MPDIPANRYLTVSPGGYGTRGPVHVSTAKASMQTPMCTGRA